MESAKDVHPLSAAIEVDIVDHDGNVLPVGTEGRIRTRGVFSAEGYVHGRLESGGVFLQEGSRLGDIDGTGPSQVQYSAHWRKDNDNPGFANFFKLLSEPYLLPCAG